MTAVPHISSSSLAPTIRRCIGPYTVSLVKTTNHRQGLPCPGLYIIARHCHSNMNAVGPHHMLATDNATSNDHTLPIQDRQPFG